MVRERIANWIQSIKLITKFDDYFVILKKQQNIMDIPALKIDLMQKILNTQDPSLLFKINNIKKKK